MTDLSQIAKIIKSAREELAEDNRTAAQVDADRKRIAFDNALRNVRADAALQNRCVAYTVAATKARLAKEAFELERARRNA